MDYVTNQECQARMSPVWKALGEDEHTGLRADVRQILLRQTAQEAVSEDRSKRTELKLNIALVLLTAVLAVTAVATLARPAATQTYVSSPNLTLPVKQNRADPALAQKPTTMPIPNLDPPSQGDRK